jgi:hypothetical protein
MIGRQFDEIRRRFYTYYLLGEVEGGLTIRVSKFNYLGGIVLRAANGSREGTFDQSSGFSGGCAHFLESFLGRDIGARRAGGLRSCGFGCRVYHDTYP